MSRTGPKIYRAALDLPIPPSVNALWSYGRGRVRRSDEYQAWLREAGWELKQQRPISIPSPVALTLKAGLPDRPRDIDNIAKAALDLLQAHGVIENDVAVVDLHLRWDRVVPKGRVHIELWRTIAPARRIGAETRAKVSAATKTAFEAAFKKAVA